MKRAIALAVLMVSLVVTPALPLECEGAWSSWTGRVYGPPMEVLDTNATSEGINVSLGTHPGPPFHELEKYYLQVVAFIESLDPLENISLNVSMGMDSLGPPELEESWYEQMVAPNDGQMYVWYYVGIMAFQPSSSNRMLLAQISHGNETVNLTYEMEVHPARAWLVPHRVLPPNHTGDPELQWTPLEILIENIGGLGVTDLVVDIVYMDRIVSTHDIPVIVGGGNHTITTHIMPVHNRSTVSVRLVSGPDAPRGLGDLEMYVVARPVLDIVGLSVEPDVVESGEKVQIEAVVRNRGNATTTGQLVELMVDGSIVANETIHDLGPGNETKVSAKWALRGEGLHSVSAVAEGDEINASPVSVEVKAPSPNLGTWAAVLILLMVSLAARRSRPAGRA